MLGPSAVLIQYGTMRDQVQDLLLGDPLRVPFVCAFRRSRAGRLKLSITNLGGWIGASRIKIIAPSWIGAKEDDQDPI
jgi:hypothetical protein